jgi:hypothetical protein
MDALTRIKRLVLRGAVRYSKKTRWELICDGLFESDVADSILNAPAIYKTLRARSKHRQHAYEKLYVIKGLSYDRTLIYTKGKIAREESEEVF